MKKKFFLYTCIFIILISLFTACKKSDETTKKSKNIYDISINPENKGKHFENKTKSTKSPENKTENNSAVNDGIAENANADELNIVAGAPSQSSVAVVKSLSDDELKHFNIVETRTFKENEEFADNMLFTPITDKITVEAFTTSFDEETYTASADELLWETSLHMGESLLLKTPLRETIPDLLLMINSDDKTVYWYNGYDGLGEYNLSYYINDSYFIDSNWYPGGTFLSDIVIAYESLIIYDEIKNYIADGMQIYFTAEYENINSVACPIFVLGTDHPEQFVREIYYAFDPVNMVAYYLDPVTGEWQILGMG